MISQDKKLKDIFFCHTVKNNMPNILKHYVCILDTWPTLLVLELSRLHEPIVDRLGDCCPSAGYMESAHVGHTTSGHWTGIIRGLSCHLCWAGLQRQSWGTIHCRQYKPKELLQQLIYGVSRLAPGQAHSDCRLYLTRNTQPSARKIKSTSYLNHTWI